ncbi:hypothetical protein Nos7524_3202 [Nostoc sp. PCC 7524]|uniref:hypothetical protein n=1 Tax=Nostoc sp. (strain ATCC 29411 / PCC 7524) TaxID=28072 RepID=UPI00029EFB85|nr:hypothetical protein [Nostoc sp. PCC 7524]AFY49002.1 hypothetical protein Nos7524_3202 [Nostoc sp. PCC 7524]
MTSLYQKLSQIEGKMAEIDIRLGIPQRRNLLIRHQSLNPTTRQLEIVDTLVQPKPLITSIPPKFVNLPVSIEGADSIFLSINDIQVEIPRTHPKRLFIPEGNTRAIFILEPPISNNQVVYINPATKTINGADIYRLVVLMENDPTLWKLILRRDKDKK